MREVSLAENLTTDECFEALPFAAKSFVERLRVQKKEGNRPHPSATLVDRSRILSAETRALILDTAAELVDENLSGRSDMCRQFSELITLSLKELGVDARVKSGKATYYLEGGEKFGWEHYWVRCGKEIIDGNTDSMSENPEVPPGLSPRPFWGPVAAKPRDRRLREKSRRLPKIDRDVLEIWWPDLKLVIMEHQRK